MSKPMLTGTTLQIGDKFGVEITLETPDGETTTIKSGPVCDTDREAHDLMRANMHRLLAAFRKEGVTAGKIEEGQVQ